MLSGRQLDPSWPNPGAGSTRSAARRSRDDQGHLGLSVALALASALASGRWRTLAAQARETERCPDSSGRLGGGRIWRLRAAGCPVAEAPVVAGAGVLCPS